MFVDLQLSTKAIMLQLILIAATFAVFIYYCYIKPMTYWKDRGVNQSKHTAWMFGDNFRSLFKMENFAYTILRLYNEVPGSRYHGAYQLKLPTLLIKDPKLIKQIGIKDFDHFTDHRSFLPGNTDFFWSRNLLALKGQNWRNMRSVLSPSFTSSKIKNIFVLITECAESFSNYFLKQNQDVVEVEMKDILTRFANDVIATTAYGIKVDSLEDPTNEFYVMGKKLTNFSFLAQLKLFCYAIVPELFVFLKIPVFNKEVGKFFTRIIVENIKSRKEEGIVRPDMLNLLLEAQKGLKKKAENDLTAAGFASGEESNLSNSGNTSIKELTTADIIAQAFIFLFAGFDTVSTALCFMTYELALNPDIQTRLRKEIEDTLKDFKEELTYEAVTKMKYMDMVVSESLRKWPSLIVTDRLCTKAYTIQPTQPDEKPLHLEAGSPIWLPIFAVHWDPTIYPDPERFDPERFNDENKGNIKPYTYIPFGVGPRNCIGQRFALLEIKVMLFNLLSKFELVPTAKTNIPIRLSGNIGIGLSAEAGFYLGFKRLVK